MNNSGVRLFQAQEYLQKLIINRLILYLKSVFSLFNFVIHLFFFMTPFLDMSIKHFIPAGSLAFLRE